MNPPAWGCFPLYQTDRSQIGGNTRRKWNYIFLLKRANQWEWLLPFFIPFPNSLIRAKNRFVKNETLEYEHDALEQYTRKFNIEIHGIPEYEGENLQDIVIKTGQRMSVDVITEDIDIVHRLYRKSPAIKPIIVRFTTYKKRREFYKSRFNLKEANTTEIIGSTQGDKEGRIFINENLTQYRQEILAKARKMKRANKIYRVWTVDGIFFVRKTEESRPRRINEAWDLEELAT